MRGAQIIRRRHQIARRAVLVQTPDGRGHASCVHPARAEYQRQRMRVAGNGLGHLDFLGQAEQIAFAGGTEQHQAGDARVAVVAGQRLRGVHVHIATAQRRDHRQPDAFKTRSQWCESQRCVHGLAPRDGGGRAHRSEFCLGQPAHDGMHHVVQFVAGALQLQRALRVRMVHRQQVDADPLTQRLMQREAYLQGIQRIDPDRQRNLLAMRQRQAWGEIARSRAARVQSGNHGVGGAEAPLAAIRVSCWLMTIPL
ncbi:hypothetical protein D3C71_1469690 [compost metagenome]